MVFSSEIPEECNLPQAQCLYSSSPACGSSSSSSALVPALVCIQMSSDAAVGTEKVGGELESLVAGAGSGAGLLNAAGSASEANISEQERCCGF